MSTLRPCPFCGERGMLVAFRHPDSAQSPEICTVACRECKASTAGFNGPTARQDSTRAWNRRQNPRRTR